MASLFFISSMIVSLMSVVYGGSYGPIPDGMIATPHGVRPKECVIGHNESNVTLEETASGVWAYYHESNTRQFFPSSKKCIDNSKEILSNYGGDNGGWMFAEQAAVFDQIGYFSSIYTTPNQDLVINSKGYTLFYFIGMTGTDKNNVQSIIQPVLTWCGTEKGCQNSDYSGWVIASWNCCPSGQTHYAKTVPMTKGEKATTYMTYDPSTGKVEVYAAVSQGKSILTLTGIKRDMNGAQTAVGEFYGLTSGLTSCNDMNTDPAKFGNMTMRNINGDKVVLKDLKWIKLDTNPLNCGGVVKFNNAAYTEAELIASTK
eukprot:397913_1